MNSLNKNVIVFALLLPIVAVHASTQGQVYPVSVSENGKYFVDQNGNPVFWLGTTQWQIFREYTVEEARTIIESAREKGFVFVQTMLMGVGDGMQPNVYGEKPWINNDPLTDAVAHIDNSTIVFQFLMRYSL